MYGKDEGFLHEGCEDGWPYRGGSYEEGLVSSTSCHLLQEMVLDVSLACSNRTPGTIETLLATTQKL